MQPPEVLDPDRRYSTLLDQHRRKHKSLLPDAWKVDLPIFEGPLDLLLHLIRLHEVEVTDIPVAAVCDQYHEYLELMDELDLDIAGEYIYEAALLIQIKSRLLLPEPKIEPGEEPMEDPRQVLVERLLEYQRLKEAAQTLAEADTLRRGLWARDPAPIEFSGEEGESLSVGDVSLYDLLKVFRNVLQRYDREHPPPLVFRGEQFSIRDQTARLLDRLKHGHAIDLGDDLLGLSCRGEAIAAFLAVLELGRLQLIRLTLSEEGVVLLHGTGRQASQLELQGLSS